MRLSLIVILFIPFLLRADTAEILFPPVELANRAHVQAPNLSSSDYEAALELFFGQLDPTRSIFTEKDIDVFMESEEQNRGKASLEFLVLVRNIYSLRVRHAISTLTGLKSSRLDFTGELELSDVDYTDEIELRHRLGMLVKFEILRRIYLEHLPTNKQQFKELIADEFSETKEQVIRSRIRSLQKDLSPPEGLQRYLYFLYCRALLSRFDPHTAVLSPEDMDRFQQSLSSTGKSFGLVLRSNALNEIEIARIVPGGSAWKSGQINPRDVIIEVRFPARKERIYGADLGPTELQEILSSHNSGPGVFKIRKPDGIIIQVTLQKETVRLEENIVTGFILRGERKLGYIYLPSFYQSWESEELPASASDVAAEIIKLRREGIDGLILDLRNNGGGSLAEAEDLCGLFIDSGPLFFGVQGDQVEIFKDPNRGAVYRDPLLVLVNEQSASASEFFAGTMKDYNRALIVGRRTFGKATAQRMLPFRDPAIGSPGYLNITTRIFYNLQGKSHQGVGVEPHIALPQYSPFVYREGDLPSVLEADDIEKRLPYEKGPELPLSELRDRSEDRVDDSDGFRIVRNLLENLEALGSMPESVTLEPDEFYEEMEPIRLALQAGMSAGDYRVSAFQASVQSYDRASQTVDPYTRNLYEERIKQLQGDPYLEEAFYILNDYIELTDKKGRSR